MNPDKVLASDLDYHLPEELIAQEPLADRSASRLLHLDRASGEVSHRQFKEAPGFLREGDLLVFNNTMVSALRLFGKLETGGVVEALLFGATAVPGHYRAMTKPSKKLTLGRVIEFEQGLRATVESILDDGFRTLDFGQSEDLDERLRTVGLAPLPPYIKKNLEDQRRYQTVYAEVPGSAAAPTAGLHFTEDILKEIRDKGVKTAFVTLDVSTDTFRPMTENDPANHVMHGERCSISPDQAAIINEAKGRIIAVGTTTVRTLESFATDKKLVQAGDMVSRIFLTPGYEFKIVDGMFTNFHMPRTTMMLMISALAAPAHILGAYKEAVDQKYRFLSFGDSMLIL